MFGECGRPSEHGVDAVSAALLYGNTNRYAHTGIYECIFLWLWALCGILRNSGGRNSCHDGGLCLLKKKHICVHSLFPVNLKFIYSFVRSHAYVYSYTCKYVCLIVYTHTKRYTHGGAQFDAAYLISFFPHVFLLTHHVEYPRAHSFHSFCLSANQNKQV